MIVLLLLFVALTAWGLRDGDLDWADVVKVLVLVMVGSAIAWFAAPALLIVPFVLGLILLILKVFGGDVLIR